MARGPAMLTTPLPTKARPRKPVRRTAQWKSNIILKSLVWGQADRGGGRSARLSRSELDREVGLDAVLLQTRAEAAVIGHAQIDIGVEVEIEPGFEDRAVARHRTAADGKGSAIAEGVGRCLIDRAERMLPADHAAGRGLQVAQGEVGFAADAQRQVSHAGIGRTARD